jgi:plastocyanin
VSCACLRRTVTITVAVAFIVTACSSQEASPPPADAEPQVQPGATLLGTVGTAEEPEAFEIALKTQGGEPVEVLAAGSYTLVVDDLAQIHNFHLTGTGVDVATDISGTGKDSFDVTFQSGTYRYLCDPHPSMNGVLQAV